MFGGPLLPHQYVLFSTFQPSIAMAMPTQVPQVPSRDDLIVGLSIEGEGTARAHDRFVEEPLSADQFHALSGGSRSPTARARIYRDGWRIDVIARAGSMPPDPATLAEANAALDSVTVSSAGLCPCRGESTG